MTKTRSQQRADVQNATLETAVRLFVTRGYKETTMADISLASGIHIGSIYNVFRDKEDIVCEIALRNYRILNEKARGIFGRPDSGGCFLFPAAEVLMFASYSPRFARIMCVAYSTPKAASAGLEMQRSWMIRNLAADGVEYDSDAVVSSLCAANGALAGLLTRYCEAPRSEVRKDLLLLIRVYSSLFGFRTADDESLVDTVMDAVRANPPETLLLTGLDPSMVSSLRRGDVPEIRRDPPGPASV